MSWQKPVKAKTVVEPTDIRRTMTQDGGEYNEIYLEAELTPKTQTTET